MQILWLQGGICMEESCKFSCTLGTYITYKANCRIFGVLTNISRITVEMHAETNVHGSSSCEVSIISVQF
jgi:hypothetical protein